MKNAMTFICMAVIMLGIGSCKRTIEPVSKWGCYVFVTNIPGAETILLAKSGLSGYEAQDIWIDFESQYGKGNLEGGYSVPYRKMPDGLYFPIYGPGITPDCYEVTMMLEFPGAPPVKDLLSGLFSAVKADGNIAICKYYGWALEEDVKDIIPRLESWYQYVHISEGPGGKIIGTPTMINLGPEVHNMPIEF